MNRFSAAGQPQLKCVFRSSIGLHTNLFVGASEETSRPVFPIRSQQEGGLSPPWIDPTGSLPTQPCSPSPPRRAPPRPDRPLVIRQLICKNAHELIKTAACLFPKCGHIFDQTKYLAHLELTCKIHCYLSNPNTKRNIGRWCRRSAWQGCGSLEGGLCMAGLRMAGLGWEGLDANRSIWPGDNPSLLPSGGSKKLS